MAMVVVMVVMCRAMVVVAMLVSAQGDEINILERNAVGAENV